MQEKDTEPETLIAQNPGKGRMLRHGSEIKVTDVEEAEDADEEDVDAAVEELVDPVLRSLCQTADSGTDASLKILAHSSTLQAK